MKQRDVAQILIIIVFSVALALLVTNFLLNTTEKRSQQVEVVEPITAEFIQPSEKYFNEKSVNPTQLITIGENNNNRPFTGN